MHSLRKNVWRVLAAGLMYCLFMAAAATDALAASAEDWQYFADACAANAQLQSAAVKERLSIKGPGVQALVDVDFKSLLQPEVQLGGTVDASYATLLGTGGNASVPFYLRQDRDMLAIYFAHNGNWQKLLLPVDGQAYGTVGQPAARAFVKDIAVIADGELEKTMLVTLDGQKVAAAVKQCAQDNSDKTIARLPKKAQAAQLERQKKIMRYIDIFCEAMGDLQYSWTVDKKTMQSKAVGMDLSVPFQQLAAAVLADPDVAMDKAQRETLKYLLSTCQVKLQVDYSDLNNVDKVEVPAEITELDARDSI